MARCAARAVAASIDGDRDDNTWRRLSRVVLSHTLGSSIIVLDGVLGQGTAMHRREISEGDQIKIRDEIFLVQWTCTYTLTSTCAHTAKDCGCQRGRTLQDAREHT